MQEGFEPEHARDRTERRDARENRRLLLEVAKHLFAEQGIAATTPMLFSPLGMPLTFDTAHY
jgi:hypothetical protein